MPNDSNLHYTLLFILPMIFVPNFRKAQTEKGHLLNKTPGL
jgi:hypothetical protein